MESCGSELTLFYGGKVHVFRDVPALQAQALMLLLRQPDGNTDGDVRQVERSADGTPTSSSSSDTSINRRRNSNQRQPAEKLPFARKASLARFLKSRKDNISNTSRAIQKTSSSKVPPITNLINIL